jgi:hypothetical protein
MNARSEHWLRTIVGAALLAVALPAAASNLTVTYVNPEKFSDGAYQQLSFGGTPRTGEVQRDMTRYLTSLAAKQLPAGETLSIEVLDIDLAGKIEPDMARTQSNIRVVRDLDSPRIKLRYVLTRGDQTLASGEDLLTDIGFLRNAHSYASNDQLRYEKPMLGRWFRQLMTNQKKNG